MKAAKNVKSVRATAKTVAKRQVPVPHTGKGGKAAADVQRKAGGDPKGKRHAAPPEKGRVPLGDPGGRTSRGSTEREWAATDFKTGLLGVELAKSNDRLTKLLIDGGHLNPDGTSKRSVIEKAGGDITLYEAYCGKNGSLVDPKLAAMGRAIAGVAARPEIVMPPKGYKSEMWRPPTPMPEDVKKRMKQLAKPKDNGDHVAGLLRPCETLDQVYAAAAKYLKVKEKELRDKYGHLNPGQQRMNCGNRMRGHYHKQQEGKK